jgi:hypothetical protein
MSSTFAVFMNGQPIKLNDETFKVLEVQKSGRPHLHILITSIPFISHEDVYDIWQKYGG